MNFLKNVLSSLMALFVFFLLLFFGFIIIGAAFGGSDQIQVEDNTVLILNLEGIDKDYVAKIENPFETLFSDKATVGVTDIVNAIENAKTDSKIKGISILNNEPNMGMAQAKAIRDALLDFKKSKKFIVSYADIYSQRSYYLNSVSDTIFVNPIGDIEFKGLSSELMFFKDLQEKSGIKMEVIRHGKFKSAVEPFLENEMSAANREQVSSLLQSVWKTMVQEIADSRKLSPAQINAIADSLGCRTPELALQNKMIDKIVYEDQYHASIRKALKISKSDDDYNTIDLQDYASLNGDKKTESSDNTIAIIYAQGDIMPGEGNIDMIGEGSMRAALEKARDDKNIKAVVLRIDSPGGSALTSELIWREIDLTKKLKPVVVSMGNVAASGGYYIACNANTIFAEKNTITGSIGVFGLLPNATVLSKRIGISAQTVSTNANASDYSPFQPLSPSMRNQVQEGVERIYATFIKRVAEGRKMTLAQVDSIGQGRVWSGSDALRIGLVDKIGGLEDALAEASKLAKIKDYKIKNLPNFKDDFEKMFKNFPFAQSKEKMLIDEIGQVNYDMLQQIKRVTSRQGTQLMMPFEIVIK